MLECVINSQCACTARVFTVVPCVCVCMCVCVCACMLSVFFLYRGSNPEIYVGTYGFFITLESNIFTQKISRPQITCFSATAIVVSELEYVLYWLY